MWCHVGSWISAWEHVLVLMTSSFICDLNHPKSIVDFSFVSNISLKCTWTTKSLLCSLVLFQPCFAAVAEYCSNLWLTASQFYYRFFVAARSQGSAAISHWFLLYLNPCDICCFQVIPVPSSVSYSAIVDPAVDPVEHLFLPLAGINNQFCLFYLLFWLRLWEKLGEMQQVYLCGESSTFLQTATSTLQCPERRQDGKEGMTRVDHTRKHKQQGRAGPTFWVLVRGKSRTLVTRDSRGLWEKGGLN